LILRKIIKGGGGTGWEEQFRGPWGKGKERGREKGRGGKI